MYVYNVCTYVYVLYVYSTYFTCKVIRTYVRMSIYVSSCFCVQFDRDVIQLSATRCCSLQTLLLEALSGVDDDIVCSIAHNLPKLQRLSLRNCSYTDFGICEVAKHCSQLRMLALDGNYSLTDRGVRALAENCPCLNELYLLGSDRVSQIAVEHVVVSMYNNIQ